MKLQFNSKRIATQEKSARARCRKSHDIFISKNFSIFEDDETYIKYDHQQIPGAVNNISRGSGVYYISKYRGEADKKFKCTKHGEFAKKPCLASYIQLWQKSAPYINESTLTSEI